MFYVGQGFGSSLARQFWLKVYHELAIQVAGSTALTAAGDQSRDASLTWPAC